MTADGTFLPPHQFLIFKVSMAVLHDYRWRKEVSGGVGYQSTLEKILMLNPFIKVNFTLNFLKTSPALLFT